MFFCHICIILCEKNCVCPTLSEFVQVCPTKLDKVGQSGQTDKVGQTPQATLFRKLRQKEKLP